MTEAGVRRRWWQAIIQALQNIADKIADSMICPECEDGVLVPINGPSIIEIPLVPTTRVCTNCGRRQ